MLPGMANTRAPVKGGRDRRRSGRCVSYGPGLDRLWILKDETAGRRPGRRSLFNLQRYGLGFSFTVMRPLILGVDFGGVRLEVRVRRLLKVLRARRNSATGRLIAVGDDGMLPVHPAGVMIRRGPALL
jgi:hypothetical protein